MPRVACVKVHSLRQSGYATLEDWKRADASHVYIGRWVPYVEGTYASFWSNPFPVKRYGRKASLHAYENHVRNRQDIWDALDELRGKTLGCWCADDNNNSGNEEICHGHVLRRLYREKMMKEQSAAAAAPVIGGPPPPAPAPALLDGTSVCQLQKKPYSERYQQ